jgi:hypothetical protein
MDENRSPSHTQIADIEQQLADQAATLAQSASVHGSAAEDIEARAQIA